MNGKILSLLVLTILFLTACEADTSTPTVDPLPDISSANIVTAEGTLMPERSVELAFAQGGVVKVVFFQPGERVQAGDIIAQLVGVEAAQAELAAAQLEQTLAQQAFDALHRNALRTSAQTDQALLDAQDAYETLANRWNLGDEEDATDLELSIEDYVVAEENYRQAREELEEVLNLDEDDRDRVDAQEDYDSEEVALRKAYTELKTALAKNEKSLDEETIALLGAISNLEAAREIQARLDDSNLDSEVHSAAQVRLNAAAAYVAAAEAAMELYELRAPFSGVLLSSDLTVGEIAPPMMPVAFVADTSQWIVKTKDLAEVDVANVAVGDAARVKFDAFPNEEFTGTVTEVNPVGKVYLGDMTYQVTIKLDEVHLGFLWNMSAVVSIFKE